MTTTLLMNKNIHFENDEPIVDIQVDKQVLEDINNKLRDIYNLSIAMNFLEYRDIFHCVSQRMKSSANK